MRQVEVWEQINTVPEALTFALGNGVGAGGDAGRSGLDAESKEDVSAPLPRVRASLGSACASQKWRPLGSQAPGRSLSRVIVELATWEFL